MPHSKLDRNRLYWPLQISGWLAYGIVGFVINSSFESSLEKPKIAGLALSGSATLLLLTHLLRGYAKRRNWTKLHFGPLILRLLLATLLISIVSQCFLSLLMVWPFGVISDDNPYSVGILLIYIFQTQIILLLWSFIYFSYHALRNYKNEEIEKWRLHAAVTDAELIALKAQINPHFIFNCLNNVRALVLENPTRAREAITRLSDLLRYSLQYAKAESVTVEQELAIVKDYLALESIHMEQRLRYQFDVAPEAQTRRIPPMSIQVLVENAIKHGLAQMPAGGQIEVKAQIDHLDQLRIEVLNTGQLDTPRPSSTGVGLPNARERLALLHGPTAQLTLENRSATQVAATIQIPNT